MPENTTSKTIEDKEIRTNVREVIKFIGIFVTVAAFVYSIKSDIKDLGNDYKIDKKVTELRLSAIELRLSQMEQEQKRAKEQRDADIQKQIEKSK